MRIACALVLVALALLTVPPRQVYAATQKRNWAQEKCARYKRDWAEALRRFGADGLTEAFINGNDAFIAAGCSVEPAVCPRTERERQFVDILTMRVVNEGMSSTFLPFACRS